MRHPAQTFEDLDVWQNAHRFVLAVYPLTAGFPREEAFCLVPQFRRAAISVPANIAEGFKRRGPADKKRFYNIAQASLEECRYYLRLSHDLGYGDGDVANELASSIARQLSALVSSIRPAAE